MSENNENDLNGRRRNLNVLVSAIYRVTERFPTDEILRSRLREQALNILNHAEHAYFGDEEHFNKFVASVRTLVNYWELAEQQNWVDRKNFMILKNSFFNFLNTFAFQPSPQPVAKNPAKFSLPSRNESKVDSDKFTGRQNNILNHIRQNSNSHVAELASMFPDVSQRTIRRDLDGLITAGLIIKKGKTNGTVYESI